MTSAVAPSSPISALVAAALSSVAGRLATRRAKLHACIGNLGRVTLRAVGATFGRVASRPTQLLTNGQRYMELCPSFIADPRSGDCSPTTAGAAWSIARGILGWAEVDDDVAARMGARVRADWRRGRNVILDQSAIDDARALAEALGVTPPPPLPAREWDWLPLGDLVSRGRTRVCRCPGGTHDDTHESMIFREHSDGTGHGTCLACGLVVFCTRGGGGGWRWRPRGAGKNADSIVGVDRAIPGVDTPSSTTGIRILRESPPKERIPTPVAISHPMASYLTGRDAGFGVPRHQPTRRDHMSFLDMVRDTESRATGPAAQRHLDWMADQIELWSLKRHHVLVDLPDRYVHKDRMVVDSTKWGRTKNGSYEAIAKFHSNSVTGIVVDWDKGRLPAGVTTDREAAEALRPAVMACEVWAKARKGLSGRVYGMATSNGGVQVYFELAAEWESEGFYEAPCTQRLIAEMGATVGQAIAAVGWRGGAPDRQMYNTTQMARRTGPRVCKDGTPWMVRLAYISPEASPWAPPDARAWLDAEIARIVATLPCGVAQPTEVATGGGVVERKKKEAA